MKSSTVIYFCSLNNVFKIIVGLGPLRHELHYSSEYIT